MICLNVIMWKRLTQWYRNYCDWTEPEPEPSWLTTKFDELNLWLQESHRIRLEQAYRNDCLRATEPDNRRPAYYTSSGRKHYSGSIIWKNLMGIPLMIE